MRSKAEETCYHNEHHELAASLVDHPKKDSIAPEKMDSLFPLLTGFWSLLLLLVHYTFYSQPEKSLASTAVNPELLTFVLFIEQCTMITYCSFKMPPKTNLAGKEKFKGPVFGAGVFNYIDWT